MLRQGNVSLGFILAIGGSIAFLWASSKLQEQSPSKKEIKLIKSMAKPVLFGLLGLTGFLIVMLTLTDPVASTTQERWANWFWVISFLSLIAGSYFLDDKDYPVQKQISNWWKENQAEILLVFAFVLLAFVARTVFIQDLPYPWSGDEASVGSEGRRIIAGEVTDFFETSWSGQPNWSFFPTAISISLFGENIVGIRMVSILAGTFTVLFVYLLGKDMFNKTVGSIAAGFLALYPIHLHFSRIGVNNINDGLMITLVLWLILRAFKSRKIIDFVLAGVLSGLTMYTYVGTRLVLVLALGAFLYNLLLHRKKIRSLIQGISSYIIALLITATPIAYFFSKHPDIFINRIGQEGIIFNGWLANQALALGISQGQVLLDQLSKSTLVFIATAASGNFFYSPKPYLTVLGALLFIIGMVYSVQKIRDQHNLVLLAWFWSVILLGGVLTLNPPAHTRMIMTTPVVALFIGFGIWQLTEAFGRLNISQQWRTRIAIILVAILVIENGFFYFKEYREGYYFQEANSELAMETGFHLKELGPNYDLIMLGQPRVFTGFPTINFLAPENIKYDINVDQLETIEIQEGHGALFIVIPENMSAIQQIENLFPGGKKDALYRITVSDEVLYYTYTVPAE